jgi:hypothetical protein
VIGLNQKDELKMHDITSMEKVICKEKVVETKFKRSSLQKYVKNYSRQKLPRTMNTKNSK